jgi:gliding motility-associated-like protein
LFVTPNTTTSYTVVGAGCANSSIGTVTVYPLPVLSVNNKVICPNAKATLTANGANFYLWSTGATTAAINVFPAVTTTYTITGTTIHGCMSSKTAKVQVTPPPVASFVESPNPTSVFDTEIAFLNKSSVDVVYCHWDFGDGDTLSPNTTNPIHIYKDKTANYTVTLIVHNSTPCWDTTSQDISIGPEYAFYIANSFTPNGDGINDGYRGYGIGIVDYQLWIFDRWGNFIWSATVLEKEWDGHANGGANPAQEDVYVWKVFITDVFGKKHALQGTVTLVR